MVEKSRLKDKRVLVVDDEVDILEALEEILDMCIVYKCSTFEEGKKELESGKYDIVILDIMGVNGYKLLDIAVNKGVRAVMLTAHAFSVDDTMKSYKKGAALYVPKDKMADIASYLEDVLAAEEQKKSTWWRWLDRFGSYYDEKFKRDWQYKDKEFWKTFPYA